MVAWPGTSLDMPKRVARIQSTCTARRPPRYGAARMDCRASLSGAESRYDDFSSFMISDNLANGNESSD